MIDLAAVDIAELVGWTWTSHAKEHAATITVDEDGISFTYHRCNDVGRCTAEIGRERAPFHCVHANYGPWPQLGCPGCGRKCRILYLGNRYVRCRMCLALRHRSQNMQLNDRIWRRAAKLCRRLDPAAKSIDDLPPKPKRMRWATYRDLEERHADLMDGPTVQAMSTFMYAYKRSKKP